MPAHPKPPAHVTHDDVGESFLSNIEEITIRLENGDSLRVDIARELHTPEDPVHLRHALARAPARFAFWAYQYERANAEVKKAEHALAQEEAVVWYMYKRDFDEKLGRNYYHNIVTQRVNADEHVLDKRRHVADAQKQAGILRALRDAAQHRIYVLRALAAPVGRFDA